MNRWNSPELLCRRNVLTAGEEGGARPKNRSVDRTSAGKREGNGCSKSPEISGTRPENSSHGEE